MKTYAQLSIRAGVRHKEQSNGWIPVVRDHRLNIFLADPFFSRKGFML